MMLLLLSALIFMADIKIDAHSLHSKSSERIWPRCEPRSMCGFLQLNDNSVNVQPLCRCGLESCPLEWDSFDGHSVTHGNDQYKFCERIERLPRCRNGEKAYHSYIKMSLRDQKLLLNSGYLYCNCPGDHLLLRNSSNYKENDHKIAYMSTTYSCNTPPICEAESMCAAVTVNLIDATTFVTTHCDCPKGSYCPLSPKLAMEKFDLDRGSYYTMHCL